MSMTSFPFLLFSAIVLLVYYLVPARVQWVVLLVASMGFYAAAGGWYLPFIGVTILSTFFVARLMARHAARDEAYIAAHRSEWSKEERKAYKNKGKKRRFGMLCAGLVFNFGILGVLKYTAFALEQVNGILSLFGVGTLNVPAMILPLGISFYTFRTTAYLIDVYRGTCKAATNPAKYALFASFFPAVMQGPICRYDAIADQLTAPHRAEWSNLAAGGLRVLWGFFKKLVVADTLMGAVKIIISRPESFGGMYVLLLIILYSAVIYGDFTGGIDITLGLSRMFGLRLTENFDHPFSSRSTAEYWNRWHITMGTWFTDYVFYPLSICKPMQKLTKWSRTHLGKVVGMRVPVYLSTLFTWFLTGLWHGASWNFIVWGVLNGVIILISRELEPLYAKCRKACPRAANSTAWGVFACVRTFFLMGSIRILDCYRDVPVTFRALGSMFTDLASWRDLTGGNLLDRLDLTPAACIVVALATVLIFFVSRAGKTASVSDALSKRPILWSLACAGLSLIVLICGSWGIGYDAGSFIYGIF